MAVPDVTIAVSRDFFMARRQALLLELDAIELLLCLTPRTSEIRKAAKALYPPPQYNCELEAEKREREGKE